MIESRDLFDARSHAMSAIDADQNFLRAIESVFANDETAVSRRRAPGDVAIVVVMHVIAHPIEVASFADARRRARTERSKRV